MHRWFVVSITAGAIVPVLRNSLNFLPAQTLTTLWHWCQHHKNVCAIVGDGSCPKTPSHSGMHVTLSGCGLLLSVSVPNKHRTHCDRSFEELYKTIQPA